MSDPPVFKATKPVFELTPRAHALPELNDLPGWGRLAILAVTGVLIIIGLKLIIGIAVSDGRIEYCFVEQDLTDKTFVLYGYRNTRFDSRVGHFATLSESLVAAKEMKCPLSGELKH